MFPTFKFSFIRSTDFCKSLSKSEAMGELSSISSEDDGNGSEKGFHHPFILRERPTSIIMNIKVGVDEKY